MITLKTLANATAQEVFDQITKHLLTQKKQCSVGSGIVHSCRYRNDQGLKCAAGCLIGDDEYADTMEKLNWEELIPRFNITDVHMHMIQSLQGIHDGCPVNYWADELKQYAYNAGLKFNPPTNDHA